MNDLSNAVGNLLARALLSPETVGPEMFDAVPEKAITPLPAPLRTAWDTIRADVLANGAADTARIVHSSNGDRGSLIRLLTDLTVRDVPTDPADILLSIIAEAEKAKPEITVLENMQPRTVEELILDNSLTAPEDVFEGLMSLGELTVVGGPPKAMKSWTVKTIGLMAATGAPWLGFKAHRPFKTLLLSAEGREVRLRERFQTLIGFTPVEEEGLRVMSYLSTGGKLKIDTDAGEATFLRLVEPFELIILDPLYRFIAQGDENSHSDARRVQDVFDRVKTLGKCILLVHHVRKATGINTGISELRGAGLDGFTDGAIMLSRKREDQDDRFSVRFTLRNFEDPPDMELIRQGVALIPAPDMERQRGGVSTNDVISIVEQLGETQGTRLSTHIKEVKGVSKATAERAVADAVKYSQGRLDWKPAKGRGQGRVYYLRDAGK